MYLLQASDGSRRRAERQAKPEEFVAHGWREAETAGAAREAVRVGERSAAQDASSGGVRIFAPIVGAIRVGCVE